MRLENTGWIMKMTIVVIIDFIHTINNKKCHLFFLDWPANTEKKGKKKEGGFSSNKIAVQNSLMTNEEFAKQKNRNEKRMIVSIYFYFVLILL